MKHYHDLEKDEMVYDENLHYNIVKFEGWTTMWDFAQGHTCSTNTGAKICLLTMSRSTPSRSVL